MIGFTQGLLVFALLGYAAWLTAGRHIWADHKAAQARAERRWLANRERHPTTRAQAQPCKWCEPEDRSPHEQHASERQNLINNAAFIEAQGRHGVAYVEAYANGEVAR